MSFRCDPNSGKWHFYNIRAVGSDDESMSGRTGEKDDETDEDKIGMADDDNEIQAANHDEIITANDDETITADDDEIVVADDNEVIKVDDDKIIMADDDKVFDDEIVAAGGDKVIATDEDKVVVEDNNEIVGTDGDEETSNDEIGDMSDSEDSDFELIPKETASDAKPVIINDEDLFDQILDEFILELAFESHRAAKLGYMEGNLSALFWKTCDKYRPQRKPAEPVKPENGKRKKKRSAMADQPNSVICPNVECGHEIGASIYARHFASCVGGTGRNKKKVNYCMNSTFSKMALDCGKDAAPRSRKKKRGKAAAKSAASKTAAKSTGSKAAPKSTISEAAAKSAASKTAAKSTGSKAAAKSTYSEALASTSQLASASTSQLAFASTSQLASASTPQLASASTSKALPHATTQGQEKRKTRKPAYTYQGLLEMSLEEKRTFFSEHCGVQLKFSKKKALCAKAVCTTHSDLDRAGMRIVYLGPEADIW